MIAYLITKCYFCFQASTAEFLNHHLRENNFKSVNFNNTVVPNQRALNYREFAFGEVSILLCLNL